MSSTFLAIAPGGEISLLSDIRVQNRFIKSKHFSFKDARTNNGCENISQKFHLVCSATQPFLVSSRDALRDDTENGCVAD